MMFCLRIGRALLAVGTLIPIASCGFHATVSFSFPETAREEFSLSAASEGITSLTVDWKVGTITVRVDDTATEITATGQKSARASSDDRAAEALDGFSITLAADEADPAQLLLTFAEADGTSSVVFAADVEVVLPASLVLDITNNVGEVTVTGNADNTTIDVNAGTVVVNSEGGNVTVDVDTGSITISAQPVDAESIIARLDVGNMDISVPADTAASLTLDVGLGAVDAELADFVLTDLETSATRLTATLNGGGSEITAEVDVGSVSFGTP